MAISVGQVASTYLILLLKQNKRKAKICAISWSVQPIFRSLTQATVKRCRKINEYFIWQHFVLMSCKLPSEASWKPHLKTSSPRPTLATSKLCKEFPELLNPELSCFGDFELEVGFNSVEQPIFCKPRSVPFAISENFYVKLTMLLESYRVSGLQEFIDWETPKFPNRISSFLVAPSNYESVVLRNTGSVLCCFHNRKFSKSHGWLPGVAVYPDNIHYI